MDANPADRPNRLRQAVQAWMQQRLETLTGKIALLVSAVVLLILAGSALSYFGLHALTSYGDAIWWALDHLVDPGAIGDDDTWSTRLVGLALAIAGLIILAGILFTLLTEVVERSLERLTEFDVPLRLQNHLLIVGWDDAVPDILQTLDMLRGSLVAESSPPFRSVAVLASPDRHDDRTRLVAQLRHALPWAAPQVALGDLTQEVTYDLGAAADAYAILVTGNSSAAHGVVADANALQSAVALARFLGARLDSVPAHRPRVSVIFERGEHADAAEAILPAWFDGVVVDRIVTGMLALELTAPAWSQALRGLLVSGEGTQLHLVQDERLAGIAFGELAGRFETALPIGLVEATHDGIETDFTPHPATPLAPGQAVIVLAPDETAAQRIRPTSAARTTAQATPVAHKTVQEPRTILMLGFNQRMIALLRELARTPATPFQVILVSQLPAAERQQQLPAWVLNRLPIQYRDDDPSDLVTLRQTIAESKPDAIIVSGDWSAKVSGTPDAAAVFTYLGVRRMVRDEIPVLAVAYTSTYPYLLEQETGTNLPGAHEMIGGTLAWTLFRGDIMPVLEAFYDPTRVTLPTAHLPRSFNTPVRFDALYYGALEQGAMLAGIVRPDGTPWLAPPPSTDVPPGTQLLVITPSTPPPPRPVPTSERGG